MFFNRKIMLAIAAGSTAGAVPALAQDAFQGPYVSVFGGGTRSADSSDDTLVFDTDRDGTYEDTVNTSGGANAFSPGFCDGNANGPTPDEGCRGDDWEFDYGIRAGFDGRPGGGSFLAGVLVEYQRSNASDSTTGFSTTPANYVVTRQLDDAFNARGRLGFVFGDSVLAYATGGGSYGKIKHDFSTTNGANSFTQVNANDRVWGWQGGGGAEFALTSTLSLGVEYLYSTYDADDYSVAVGPGTAPATNPFLLVDPDGTNLRPSDSDLNIHAARATMSFRF